MPVLFASVVLVVPYTPGQIDPLPPRVTAYNAYADIAYGLSLGSIRKRAIRCAIALERDLSDYIRSAVFELLPIHVIGTVLILAILRFLVISEPPRWVLLFSRVFLAALGILWVVVLVLDMRPTSVWDVPLLVRATIFLGPVTAIFTLVDLYRRWRLRFPGDEYGEEHGVQP